jgi:hypothetical protein
MTVKRRRYGRTGHGYAVDGSKVPGVTTILGDTLPKDGLTDWAARCGADEVIDYWDELAELRPSERHQRVHFAYRHDRDAAAKRGTEVHRIAEALNNWAEGDPEVPVPEELAGHVDAYRDFLDTIRPAALLGGTELVVANRTLRYCGTADLVADLPALNAGDLAIPAARWLLELKTTRSGIWPESALQACAYFHAEVFVDPADPDDERRMDWLQIERCGVVWIKSDAWELRPVDTGPTTWDYFQHLRWLYDHQDDKPGWIGMTADPAFPAELVDADRP